MVKNEYVGELKDEVEEIVMMDEKKEEEFSGSFSKGRRQSGTVLAFEKSLIFSNARTVPDC